jgi:AraC family transcriptional regulator
MKKRRLTYAAELLFHSDEKVINIAIDVGFQYQESFNRAFKKFYVFSPKQYRNVVRISGPLLGKAALDTKLLPGGLGWNQN